MAQGTVLVVDDDPFLVDFVEEALEDAGYTVLASDGAQALLDARTLCPDLILLDVAMQGMDAVELIRHLRDEPATADIPIVLMAPLDHLRATAALLPVNDRLPKPFAVSDLYRVVARWVKES